MGNGGGSSWLSTVMKVFRSPTKESSDKRSCRTGHDYETEEEEKKRGKRRRWVFRKLLTNDNGGTHEQQQEAEAAATKGRGASAAGSGTRSSGASKLELVSVDMEEEKRNAIAVAMATTAAAEAAVATAQAAVQFIRLTRPTCILLREENHAAMIIQKAFKGYLARRALRALKGIVKLQALVRGHNVRKRTKTTLHRMESLIRVQARVSEQRRRTSHESKSIDSMLLEKFVSMRSDLQDATTRSASRDGSTTNVGAADEWEEHQEFVKEVNSLLEILPETAEDNLRRDRNLDYKIRRSNPNQDSKNLEGLDPWRTMYQWRRSGRYSCDQRIPIKIIEVVNNANSFSSSHDSPRTRNEYLRQQEINSYSPRTKHHQEYVPHFRTTPKVSHQKPDHHLKPLRVCSSSSSPRCIRDERSRHYPADALTPTSASYYYNYRGGGASRVGGCNTISSATVPSYMGTTASAEARVRSQSTPRQRPMTPEREAVGFAKRRLSFVTTHPNEVSSPRRNIVQKILR